ncbi:MAG TPA: hypothetical protein EYP57_02810 [Thermodesulfobacteriaceae bacterium]|nr:hypothetical protein [Thermodesulfobacteriaceae bacterium]
MTKGAGGRHPLMLSRRDEDWVDGLFDQECDSIHRTCTIKCNSMPINAESVHSGESFCNQQRNEG